MPATRSALRPGRKSPVSARFGRSPPPALSRKREMNPLKKNPRDSFDRIAGCFRHANDPPNPLRACPAHADRCAAGRLRGQRGAGLRLALNSVFERSGYRFASQSSLRRLRRLICGKKRVKTKKPGRLTAGLFHPSCSSTSAAQQSHRAILQGWGRQ